MVRSEWKWRALLGSSSFIVLAALAACGGPAADPPSSSAEAMSFARSEWSEPVNLGPTINTSASDINPTLSPDGLALYFASTRTGGLGGNDLWVSRRASPDDPWGAPVNLAVLNTTGADTAPAFSVDGHSLFFVSDRPGNGLNDIWVTRRADKDDDFGWEEPVHLGPEVNTEAVESGPEFLRTVEEGPTSLYFVRQPAGGLFQIWAAPVTARGEVTGPAAPVSELWHPTGGSVGPTVRADGREIIFFSGAQAGGSGNTDLWTATRRSVHEPWEAPRNLGEPLNSAAFDQQPSLSNDGRTLVFVSNRPGGFGGLDIWMSTRTPSGQ
ncbi:MAG TPA: hypothetical protein VFR85_01460 [Anaeromyxobacteraceae bacterium]|nr:hypothetical protein [Anaeromyxobacteraceae bacterium]